MTIVVAAASSPTATDFVDDHRSRLIPSARAQYNAPDCPRPRRDAISAQIFTLAAAVRAQLPSVVQLANLSVSARTTQLRLVSSAPIAPDPPEFDFFTPFHLSFYKMLLCSRLELIRAHLQIMALRVDLLEIHWC